MSAFDPLRTLGRRYSGGRGAPWHFGKSGSFWVADKPRDPEAIQRLFRPVSPGSGQQEPNFRTLAAFLILFAAALLFVMVGETVGPHELVYASLIIFGALAAGALLRGTSNAIDWGTVLMGGRPRDKR
jgi:hypothetical protein